MVCVYVCVCVTIFSCLCSYLRIALPYFHWFFQHFSTFNFIPVLLRHTARAADLSCFFRVSFDGAFIVFAAFDGFQTGPSRAFAVGLRQPIGIETAMITLQLLFVKDGLPRIVAHVLRFLGPEMLFQSARAIRNTARIILSNSTDQRHPFLFHFFVFIRLEPQFFHVESTTSIGISFGGIIIAGVISTLQRKLSLRRGTLERNFFIKSNRTSSRYGLSLSRQT